MNNFTFHLTAIIFCLSLVITPVKRSKYKPAKEVKSETQQPVKSSTTVEVLHSEMLLNF